MSSLQWPVIGDGRQQQLSQTTMQQHTGNL